MYSTCAINKEKPFSGIRSTHDPLRGELLSFSSSRFIAYEIHKRSMSIDLALFLPIDFFSFFRFVDETNSMPDFLSVLRIVISVIAFLKYRSSA